MRKILPLLILCFCITVSGQTVYKDYADGRLYVKVSKALLAAVSGESPRNIPLPKLAFMHNLQAKYGITKASKPFYQASDDAALPYILKLEFTNASLVNALILELSHIKGVEYAEKVPIMKTDVVPNDPNLPAQLPQINAANAWNVFNGNSNITLAIVDNAVMWTHQDLVANTYTNTGEIAGNNLDDDGNGYIDDVNGWDVADYDNDPVPTNTLMLHGTHCAGIAGARTDNGIGIASIGWNIKVIPVKTTANTSNTSSIDDGYGGIVYAANAGARVISCSWGGGGFSASEQNVINYAWNKGCIIVAAAGNANTNVQSYPGAYGNVYCVSSVSSSNIKSSFSNYGTWVDIAAPGENIYSTLPSATTGTYGNLSGTSMATPLVAGLAALMLSNCSYMTQTDVLNCISSTAVNIYSITANSTYSTGLQLGAGRIEAYQAMTCASGFLNSAPLAYFFAFPVVTCPNTPVNFYDSSLYVPTSWNWTFQGGTPATSTLTNPSVQWSTPGTYSVSLTVANANGTNTATRLSYITVAGPIALPLVEGFQAAAFLPANWTANNIYNDNIYWVRAAGVGGYGTSTASAVFDNYNIDAAGERDEMRTPKYIFSNVVSARLRFDVAYARYNSFFTDTLEVRLSTNCGASWSSIYLKGGTTLATSPDVSAATFTPTSTQWRTDSIDISAATAGQGNVMFSFVNRGHYGQTIYLDNINLAFPTPTLNASTTSSACTGASFSLTNTSQGAGSYSWTFSGGTPASSTASNPSVSFAASGIHTITLIGANGTTTAAITRTVTTVALPTLSINTPTICNGAAVTLTASGASSYTWTGGPNTATLSDSPAATTVYTVTGNNSTCSAVKTGTIFVNPTPTLTVNSPTICSGTTAALSATGAATYVWTNGALTYTATVLLVTPGVTTVYSFTGTNLFNCSSQRTATVFVNATPTLAVNSPSICLGSSATLSVSGATSYSWNTGANGSSLVQSPSTTTGYTVTGTSQSCSATAATSIVVISLPTLTIVPTATSICAGGSVSLAAFGATSYQWVLGPGGQLMVVSPSSSTTYTVVGSNAMCNNTAMITISVTSPPPLLAQASPPAICAGKSATLSASGSYNIFVWSGPGGPLASLVVSPAANAAYTLTAIGGPNSGCTATSVVNVTVNSLPLSALTPANSNCSSQCSGSLTATTSGGTGPYVYNLGGGSCNTLTCTNLCVGNYTLNTQDANGCVSSANFAITAPVNNLNAQLSFTNASCATCADGSAMANPTGGQAPLTYSWSSGGSQPAISNLLPGCYTVTITDANSCSMQTVACISSSTITGLNTFSFNTANLLIYPNPARSAVTIQYTGATFDCKLYDNLGQVVRSSSHNTSSTSLALGDLAKGVYFIEISIGQSSSWKKLLVE